MSGKRVEKRKGRKVLSDIRGFWMIQSQCNRRIEICWLLTANTCPYVRQNTANLLGVVEENVQSLISTYVLRTSQSRISRLQNSNFLEFRHFPHSHRLPLHPKLVPPPAGRKLKTSVHLVARHSRKNIRELIIENQVCHRMDLLWQIVNFMSNVQLIVVEYGRRIEVSSRLVTSFSGCLVWMFAITVTVPGSKWKWMWSDGRKEK